VADYKTHGCKNVVGVPIQVKGITATRNWILNHVKDRRVVFVDDDVKNCGWLEIAETNMNRRTLTEPEWLREFSVLFDVAEELHFDIWGMANISASRTWYPSHPFLFYTYVTGSCMGIFNDPALRFDESFTVKEDYELCLRSIKKNGGVLGCRYLFWENEHWTTPAGCKTYRTQDVERDCTSRLIAKYPGMIHRVVRGGSDFSISLDF
jgi:hypothetical protein